MASIHNNRSSTSSPMQELFQAIAIVAPGNDSTAPTSDIGSDDNDAVAPNESLNIATIYWAIFNTFLFVFIIGGNMLTIIAVRSCRRLRSMIANMFIVSLAISDFIVGLALPYHITFYLGSGLGRYYGFCLMRFFFMIFACCVSILTLISIAIDRYIAIVFAIHYRRYMTRRIAIGIIAVNWMVGAGVAAIPMIWNHWSTSDECEFDQVLPSWYMTGILTPGFILIWLIMLVLYLRIMREAGKQARQLRHCTANPRARTSIHSDWKYIQIVFIIMGCFSICWTPYIVVACAQIFYNYKSTSALYKSALSLAMVNSGLNPIIYAWKNSNFRKAFTKLLRCKSPNVLSSSQHWELSQCSSPHRPSPSSHPMHGMIVVAIAPLQAIASPICRPTDDASSRREIDFGPSFNTKGAEMAMTTTAATAADMQNSCPQAAVAATEDADDVASSTIGESNLTACATCGYILRKRTPPAPSHGSYPRRTPTTSAHQSLAAGHMQYECLASHIAAANNSGATTPPPATSRNDERNDDVNNAMGVADER